ncbi:MAG: NAD-dependent epimerase/dehydratase family protein [Gemmatimonadota bacterium]|nr:NAD-dependent epimerase/dehydratase family protein [Gemmatimonadota bacterium]
MTGERGFILVTGANGEIGQAVMKRFTGQFDQVVGFDRKAPDPPPPGCTHMAVEMTSDESVREGLRILKEHHGPRIASIIHLAAYYDFFGAPSPKYDEVTVRGTERLLRGVQAAGFQVEQFVFSSTMLVHAPGEPGQFINEEWPIQPTWAYPESKVRTEKLIRSGRGTIPVVLLRISGVYDDSCHSIPLAHQIQRIYERQFTNHFYSASTAHGQAFMHADELVDAIERVVERRAQLPPELPVLLGEREALSYDELQHTLSRLIHGTPLETIVVPRLPAKLGAWLMNLIPGKTQFIKPWMIDRAGDHYALDLTKARTLLDWEPKRSLRETLPKMVAALKADPLAWYKDNKLEPSSKVKAGASASPEKAAPPVQAPSPVQAATPAKPATLANHEHGGQLGMGSMAHDAMPPGHVMADAPMTHGQSTSWPHFANMVLGLWLITSVFALDYRSTPLQVSDLVSGALVIVLAMLSLSQRPLVRFWAPWANSFVGLWLLFAPLVFWAPTAAVYSNDTLVGALVIVFAILAPGMPMAAGMSMAEGPDLPPGWSYNPSSWPQRAPIIALALVGFFLSRQMAAFELKHVMTFPDPFFGTGTVRVLTSTVSKSFPIPDAGLGAFAYTIEFLMGFMGDKARWRTMPWMVTFFGILVVPLGIVSITLIILQPLAVGAWCTPCLIAAAAMVLMIALTLDEVVAMCQFLAQATREGQPFWRTFWLGGTLRELPVVSPVHADAVRPMAMLWGVALPWNILASVALGAWLMFTPSVLGSTGTAAHSDHLLGALIVTFGVMALADVGRALRFVNMLFAALVIVAPWVVSGATSGSRWSDLAAGVLVILLSIPRGAVGERYGSWERLIR